MRRRVFLQGGGVVGVALLAGCLDQWSGGSGDDPDDANPDDDPGGDNSDDDTESGADDEADPGQEGAQSPEVVETTDVRMVDSEFEPQNVEVELGVPVTWENEDSFAHTVTAVGGSLDAEVATGETVQHVFEESRVYEVYCRHHGDRSLSGMAMKVGVGNATIEEPLGTGHEGEY